MGETLVDASVNYRSKLARGPVNQATHVGAKSELFGGQHNQSGVSDSLMEKEDLRLSFGLHKSSGCPKDLKAMQGNLAKYHEKIDKENDQIVGKFMDECVRDNKGKQAEDFEGCIYEGGLYELDDENVEALKSKCEESNGLMYRIHAKYKGLRVKIKPRIYRCYPDSCEMIEILKNTDCEPLAVGKKKYECEPKVVKEKKEKKKKKKKKTRRKKV